MQVMQDFLVRLEDTGAGFRLSNKGVLTMLTNLACLHGNRIGQGLMDREKCGLSWMVVGWRVRVDHRPRLSETVHGATWASGWNRLQTARGFLLRDEQGREAARATSSWLVLDEHNTHILRMTPAIVDPYGPEPEHPAFPDYVFPREAPAFEPERTVELRVTRAMIDCNDHVHNVAYLDLFMEALPEEEDMDRFDELTLVYRREIRPGQHITAAYGRAGAERVIVLREEDLLHAFLILR